MRHKIKNNPIKIKNHHKMTSNNIRFEAVKMALNHKPVVAEKTTTRASVIFAQNVFTREKMQEYIASNILDELFELMDNEKTLSRDIANSVAIGMKKWAMDLGATHYTHWFQPLTGGTAEKHDAFFDFDDNGKPIEKFSGSVLYQQEPDASSFPSGGIRNTFEARGYSAWDPSSPAFVIGDRLCIPTIFVAYTGEALDYKTPLLRSIAAVNKAAVGVANYFDRNVKRVTTYLGWEQEYFLVDESLFAARPDLLMTGRTLMGHYSSKNQQLDDHYFGIIPERVLAFMTELEEEVLKLGIPVKTRHNEVAPNQYELAPIFEETNLAIDHNMLIMSLMKRTARKHGFRCLLHEKPFAGINGSGKTSLCEAILLAGNAINRIGSVDAKTTVSDFMADEQEKQSSIYASVMNCVYDNTEYFFVDTPGYGEFVGQVWVQSVDDTSDLTINGGTFAPSGADMSSVFVTNKSSPTNCI